MGRGGGRGGGEGRGRGWGEERRGANTVQGVAAGTSPHPQGRQAASTASDWSDVLNLDSVSFIDWE